MKVTRYVYIDGTSISLGFELFVTDWLSFSIVPLIHFLLKGDGFGYPYLFNITTHINFINLNSNT